MIYEYLIISLVAALVYLLCSLLFSLLFRFARVYRSNGRSRILVGYLWKRGNGDLVLYNGLIPLLSHAKGRVLGGEIRLETLNENADYAERVAGYHHTTSVTDDMSVEVATLAVTGTRTAQAVAGNSEVAFAKGSIRAKDEFVTEAAAVGALMNKAVENARISPDERVGMRDLLIPSTLIYLLLYALLFPLAQQVSANRYVEILVMLAAYLLIVGIFYFVKYQLHLSNRSMTWTAMFNSNVGEGLINWVLLIVSVVALYLSTNPLLLPFMYQPALMVIILTIAATMTLTPRTRRLEDPYRGCHGSWRQSPQPMAPASAASMQTLQFSWVPVLERKHITGDEKQDCFTLTLPIADYEGTTPRVRMQNPFYQPGLTSEDDREAFTRKVLDGVDKVLRAEGATDLYEDRALAQIINSAYEVCVRYNLADFEMFDLILLFCQMNIEYKLDEECDSIHQIREYYRFASETLYDRTGDCDCKAVLAYKLFELLGVKPSFAVVKANHEDIYNHAAVVLRNDPNARIPLPPQYKEYAPGKGVYCEATSDGSFHPGDMPTDIDYDSIRIFSA